VQQNSATLVGWWVGGWGGIRTRQGCFRSIVFFWGGWGGKISPLGDKKNGSANPLFLKKTPTKSPYFEEYDSIVINLLTPNQRFSFPSKLNKKVNFNSF
jgi:hypothetical protein